MKALRIVVPLAVLTIVTACNRTGPVSHHVGERPMRPTIELLARSITYDGSKVTEFAGSRPIDVTLTFVGERLLDYAGQHAGGVASPGTVPAVASFDPPDRHECCWEPASLALAKAGATPMPAIHVPAQVEEQAPADLEVDQGTPAVQAVGVSFPGLDHVTLPASELAKLVGAGVGVGSPAVAIVDVGDPENPFVLDIRAPDARELASDPSNPPTTANLPETILPFAGHCARATVPVPARFSKTLTALGPVFFHKPIATPHQMPKGLVSMQWTVLGPDHVRALFTSADRGCTQNILVDIMPAANLVIPPSLHVVPSDFGTLYGAGSGRRNVLVYDRLSYDVKGATPFATHTFTEGLVLDAAVPERAVTE